MLSFSDICFSYPGSPLGARALSGVSLCVAPGKRVVVLGSNGSGKSTLARLANGLLLPDSGEVTVEGMSTRDDSSISEIRRNVGMVFQRPDDQIVATTVEEDVAFGPENLGVDRVSLRTRVDETLAAVGLVGMETREPHLLSGGQKQRLAIAGAVAMRPAYLVLDEPTSMLDPQGRDDVLAIIARLRTAGHGILHITHDLADMAGADTAIVLDRGSVRFAGSPDQLIAENGALLADCGLELPAVAVLGYELRERGVPLASTLLSADQIAESLWH